MTHPVKPDGTAAWYALRRTLPPWSFDQNLTELLEWLPRYRVDELMVKIDTEEFTHGQPPLEWVQAYVPNLAHVKRAVENLGIRFSLNPWITVGHIDRGRDARLQLPGLRTCIGHDGTMATCCACPLCPVWRANTERVWTLYAELRPHVLWIEDDIRTFNHLPVRYGCFCDEHLRRFSQRIGHDCNREELVDAILQPDEPHSWRREFLDLQASLMNETAAFLARIVHRTSPQTRLGLMSSGPRQHCLEGRQWKPFAEAIADGLPLYSRPPMANYWEDSLRGFYYSHDSIKLTRHCLPERDVVEQTEVENVPFTRYSKSVAATFLETAISFAYGSHGVTLNLFDHAGTPIESEPWYGRMLSERKPFFNALAQVAQRSGQYRGIGLLFNEHAPHVRQLRAGADYGALQADGQALMTMLESHGFPTTYAADARLVAAEGQQLRGLSDEHIAALLGTGRGILLDGGAAHVLMERGFGDLIGVSSIGRPRNVDTWTEAPCGAEEFFNPMFGGADGKFLTLTLPSLPSRPAVAAVVPAPGARVVSSMVDPDARRRHACSYAFENRFGGRAFVLAYDLASSYGIAFHHPFRAEQLQGAVKWLSRDSHPVTIRGDGVYPLGLRKDCDDQTLLGFFNLSLDPWTDVRFDLSDDRIPRAVARLTTEGGWEPIHHECAQKAEGALRIYQKGRFTFDGPLFLRVTWETR